MTCDPAGHTQLENGYRNSQVHGLCLGSCHCRPYREAGFFTWYELDRGPGRTLQEAKTELFQAGTDNLPCVDERVAGALVDEAYSEGCRDRTQESIGLQKAWTLGPVLESRDCLIVF